MSFTKCCPPNTGHEPCHNFPLPLQVFRALNLTKSHLVNLEKLYRLSPTSLTVPRHGRGVDGFRCVVEGYCWGTDFLTDLGLMDHLPPDAEQQLGCSGEVFGVTHGPAPHPDELIFKRWQEGGTDTTTGQNNPDGGQHTR